MNWSYQHLVPEELSPQSKAWVYQCHRLFNLAEALEIEVLLEQFLEEWRSHGDAVKGFGTLFFGRFIVLVADDSGDRLCGRAADASLRFIKEIELRFQVSLIDRQALGFIVKDQVELIPYNQLAYAIEGGFVDGDTLFFNNSITTKEGLLSEWIVPAKNSWLAKRFTVLQTGLV